MSSPGSLCYCIVKRRTRHKPGPAFLLTFCWGKFQIKSQRRSVSALGSCKFDGIITDRKCPRIVIAKPRRGRSSLAKKSKRTSLTSCVYQIVAVPLRQLPEAQRAVKPLRPCVGSLHGQLDRHIRIGQPEQAERQLRRPLSVAPPLLPDVEKIAPAVGIGPCREAQKADRLPALVFDQAGIVILRGPDRPGRAKTTRGSQIPSAHLSGGSRLPRRSGRPAWPSAGCGRTRFPIPPARPAAAFPAATSNPFLANFSPVYHKIPRRARRNRTSKTGQ